MSKMGNQNTAQKDGTASPKPKPENEVGERWSVTLYFTATKKKAYEVRDTILMTARNTEGFKAQVSLVWLGEQDV